jgi:hypothetical protein
MAQLHECAMPIGKFFSSAYCPDARAQGVVIVGARNGSTAAVRIFSYAPSASQGHCVPRSSGALFAANDGLTQLWQEIERCS